MAEQSNLAPPVAEATPAPPQPERLVTPEILFLNQGSIYRGMAYGGNANPSSVWQQMVDNSAAAMMYYRELEEKDDDIGDAIDEMKLSVLKRGWQIQPGDDSAQAAQAAEFCEQQINSLTSSRNVLSNLLDAPFYGYTVAELIFDTSMGQASLTDVTDCPQELFCFNPAMQPQVGALRLKDYAGSIDGILVPEQKFLVWSSRSRHGNRMGRPILRQLYWTSWFKRNIQRFWMRYGEKGPGTAMVTYKEGAGQDEKNKALAAAEAVINEVAVAVSENFNIVEQLLTGARSMDPATYEKLYNVLESKIYRRITGGTLTSHGSDGGKGTMALGNVHQETKEERSIELCLQSADVLNRQLFRNLTLWNFGPNVAAPKFGWEIGDEADLGEDMASADTAQGMGLPIPKKWMYSHFNIPEPQDGEETLQRPAAPALNDTTPVGSPQRPQFSAAQQSEIDRDVADLDKLFGEFSKSALRQTGKRVRLLAKGMEKLNVRPGR